MSNEKTSKRVASLAGRLLKKAEKLQLKMDKLSDEFSALLDDIQSVAASALTQVPNKKEK